MQKKKTNKDVEEYLLNEIKYYQKDYDKFVHILVRNIPRKYIIRIISKMYRLRKDQ